MTDWSADCRNINMGVRTIAFAVTALLMAGITAARDCSRNCTLEFKVVCASNGDHYLNECFFKKYRCINGNWDLKMVDCQGHNATTPAPGGGDGGLSSKLNRLAQEVSALHRHSQTMMRTLHSAKEEAVDAIHNLTTVVRIKGFFLKQEMRQAELRMKRNSANQYERITDEMRRVQRRLEEQIDDLERSVDQLRGRHPTTTAHPTIRNLEFRFISTRMTFSEAERTCGNWGGRLAVIKSAEENSRLYSFFRQQYGPWIAWIGYSDRSDEGRWLWSGMHTPPDHYTNWGLGEPNDVGGGEDCATMPRAWYGRWNDRRCTERLQALCERDAGATAAPPRPVWTTPGPRTRPQPTQSDSLIRFPRPQRGTDLVDGGRIKYISGHVEIFHRAQWGTICDDLFGDNDAQVICRTGGYSGGVYRGGIYKQRNVYQTNKIWLDNLECQGSESDVNRCRNVDWGQHNCDHSEDVGVMCYIGTPTTTGPPIPPIHSTPQTDLLDIRFPNPQRGTTIVSGGRVKYIKGHVEIYHNGQWGTICDDRFGDNDAQVICRTGGYSGGVYRGGMYKQRNGWTIYGTNKIWLDNLECWGWERDVDRCPKNNWGQHNCGHHEDVGVMCYIGTPSPSSIPPNPDTTSRPPRPIWTTAEPTTGPYPTHMDGDIDIFDGEDLFWKK